MYLETFPAIFDKYVNDTACIVTQSSLRFGSIIYICFGGMHQVIDSRGIANNYHAIEIEFGADRWIISDGKNTIGDSNFENRYDIEYILNMNVVGKKFTTIINDKLKSIFFFDDGSYIESIILENPSSGFLYAVSVNREIVFETYNGFDIAQ